MQEFNHFDFELNGIIRAFLRTAVNDLMDSVHHIWCPLSSQNIRICQTVLRRRLLLSGRLTEKSGAASADALTTPGSVTMNCGVKKISALIPPRKGAGYWPGEYADRNRAWLISE